MKDFAFEHLSSTIQVAVSKDHTFGTDSFLLAYFATPKNKDKVCDLGTGCGIIPLLWQREPLTIPSETWAVDIQPLAYEQMEATIASSVLQNFNPLTADIRDIRRHLPSGRFDVVTSNPPYKTVGSGIMSESHSDKVARHETMAEFKDFCAAAAWLLRFGGRFCVCQLPERLPDVICAMREHQIEPKRLRMVQNNNVSAPWLVLVEGKRGSRPFLTIDPPFIMRGSGNTSHELDKAYGMYGKVL